MLPLPPITVNISDPSGRRYLKLGMEVEVNADVSAALQANSPRIRDAIIMLLAGATNLREVALFPMNQQAVDLLMGAPAEATPKQLREAHLRVNLPEKNG